MTQRAVIGDAVSIGIFETRGRGEATGTGTLNQRHRVADPNVPNRKIGAWSRHRGWRAFDSEITADQRLSDQGDLRSQCGCP